MRYSSSSCESWCWLVEKIGFIRLHTACTGEHEAMSRWQSITVALALIYSYVAVAFNGRMSERGCGFVKKNPSPWTPLMGVDTTKEMTDNHLFQICVWARWTTGWLAYMLNPSNGQGQARPNRSKAIFRVQNFKFWSLPNRQIWACLDRWLYSWYDTLVHYIMVTSGTLDLGKWYWKYRWWKVGEQTR